MTKEDLKFEESLTGLWAVNGGGLLGRIERRVMDRGLRWYTGHDLAGNEWRSACPLVLAERDQQWFRSRTETPRA